ncbi:MAG: response regulator [Polyangiaceae bacterium]|nr:response regulator [Polyangiaceae bacterium]
MSALSVLVVAADAGVRELSRDVLEQAGDHVLVATSIPDGIASAERHAPDLAFVDVGLGQGAALALVHHLRALGDATYVIAMATRETLEVAAHALSLGASGLLLMPPSGDELLSAATTARARRGREAERATMRREVEEAKRLMNYGGRLAALGAGTSVDDAGGGVAQTFREITGAPVVLVYAQASADSQDLRAIAAVGEVDAPPPFSSELGLMRYAEARGLEVVPLVAGRLAAGHVLLARASAPPDGRRALLPSLAAQAATTIALVAERARGAGGALKDAETSAYTFSYFVDIAGREIDKAHRHGRRFALATFTLGDDDSRAPAALPVEVSETVLGAVRDSDVLARVDAREFYLLLPETSGIGAHACRRRVLSLRRDSGEARLSAVAAGVAAYPHDGRDLLRLLRAAKRRADASRASPVERLRLFRLPLADAVDALSWDDELAVGRGPATPETPRAVELPLCSAVALSLAALEHAARGGAVSIYVSAQPGPGLAAAIAAHPAAAREGALHSLDVRHRDGCEDVVVVALFAEHGAWALFGRQTGGVFTGLHAADPRLADLLAKKLVEAAGR